VTRLLGILLTCIAGIAWAHPLGNFTTNRQARITIAADRVQVRYVVDVAEIPTHRILAEVDANAWSARIADGVARDLHVSLDGREITLRPESPCRDGQAGAADLPTLRIEVALAAAARNVRGTLVVATTASTAYPAGRRSLPTRLRASRSGASTPRPRTAPTGCARIRRTRSRRHRRCARRGSRSHRASRRRLRAPRRLSGSTPSGSAIA
jgi:hypothetical protein